MEGFFKEGWHVVWIGIIIGLVIIILDMKHGFLI